MSKERVLFLDFHNCITNVDGGETKLYRLDCNRDEKYIVTETKSVSVRATYFLKKILLYCVQNEIKVVLTSLWRVGRTLEIFKKFFIELLGDDFPIDDLKFDMIDNSLNNMEELKENLVRQYLNKNPVSFYRIIEDDLLEFPNTFEKVILCDRGIGLLDKHYLQVKYEFEESK